MVPEAASIEVKGAFDSQCIYLFSTLLMSQDVHTPLYLFIHIPNGNHGAVFFLYNNLFGLKKLVAKIALKNIYQVRRGT